jgi:hypothetical protein
MSWNIACVGTPDAIKLKLATEKYVPEGLKTVIYEACDQIKSKQPEGTLVKLETFGHHYEGFINIGKCDISSLVVLPPV